MQGREQALKIIQGREQVLTIMQELKADTDNHAGVESSH